ncbi:glycoside hydrolase family 43 protein [Sphingomonas elodea]|uniref:glycoside hydrolase family 43 protein n=1 Tax=Sphingomonas elodea TaxID=179878 RepID=UPI000263101D|nr:glycoside hydrolase family 43 protein [Sphingomonas elodea]
MKVLTIFAATALACSMAAPALAQSPARFSEFRYAGHAMSAPAVAPGAYRNPILSGYYPDPSVTRVGNDYYLVLSSFAHYPGLPIFHSRDLVHWTQIANAIDRPGQLDFTGMRTSQAVFAPDISWHAGTFYIVNTCVSCRGNFVITAKDPRGPWSDPVWLPFEGIDPSIYWEGDRAYIVNNRAPDETARYEGHRAIWLQEFDWRTGKMVGPSTQLVNGGVDITKKPEWIEGPHVFKKDGWYYLIAAEGGTSVNHSQVVFRSRDLRGPYLPFAGNPILTQRDLDPKRPNPVTSTGHAKLVQTQTGEWWATFLGVRPYADDFYNTGRETFLLPVRWVDGWPIILPKGTPLPLVARAPRLPGQARPALPTSGDFGYVDRFAGSRLSMQWVGIRTPRVPFYKVERGELVITRGAPLGDLTQVPGFVGRRQQHANADVSVVVRYTPAKDGDRAGLAAVQSDENNLFFGLTRTSGIRTLALYTTEKGKERLVAATPLPGMAPVQLALAIRGGKMRFDYRVGGRLKTLQYDVDARFLSTHEAGGFVGTIIGPMAVMR